MKPMNALSDSDTISREASRICCLTRVNALLKALRTKLDHADHADMPGKGLDSGADNDDLHAPTPRDYCIGELEASVASADIHAPRPIESASTLDGAREVARAKLVFAVTLVVPLVLTAATLSAFGEQLGRALTAVLQFSALALATPLILALAGTAVRSGWRGMRRHPWLSFLGVVAAGGYAGSAFAMSIPAAADTSALFFAIAGLLVTAVRLGHWLPALPTKR